MDKLFEQRYLDARRKVIEEDYKSMNNMQLKAVMATEGPLLILAGAGSGKTTVLINRIENIMRYGRGSDPNCREIPADATEEDIEIMLRGGDEARALAKLDPVAPWRICAITFTNKAANELKERLTKRLGEAANDIWAATFHSACVRILRRDAELLGFPNNFTIYDASDAQSVMKQIVKEFNLDDKTFQPKAILGDLSRAKDQYISPIEYAQTLEKSGDIRKRKTAPVIIEYARRLYNAGAMDFDDLIFYTVKLLNEHAEVRDYWQNKFRYVLIDEYQDTNKIQYMLAKLLSGKWGNICVVGDDDQSIYKFRGATIENILSFEDEFKGCRTIRLEQNYRSTEHILEAANAVISNNQGRKGKNLWTNLGSGNKVLLYVTQNQDEEAQYVASKILEAYGQGANFRDHAVLYRMNAQSNQLEYAFKRNGIPYKVYGGMRFFDRAEVKDMLAYLCVINSPEDDLRLRRIINTPARGIGERTIDQAAHIASEENTSLYDVIRRANQYPDLKRAAPKLIQFVEMMEFLRKANESVTPDVLYDLVLEQSGYIAALEKKSSDPIHSSEATSRIENIKELKTNIVSYMEQSGDATLSGFLDDVALYTDLDTMDEADCVTMMTMHSAKGLEFPTVFIVGMEENMFPSTRCIGDPVEMEEERRLCYVALTRAKRMLYLLCARQRMLFGKTTSNLPSRFTEEIPDAHMDKGGYLPPKRKPLFNDDDYGYGEEAAYGATYRERSSFSGNYGSGYGTGYKKKPAPISAPKKPMAAAAAPAGGGFNVGDRVKHKAFGEGKIVKKTPMGGDALVEIEFASVGTKRLMLKVAAANMTKI